MALPLFFYPTVHDLGNNYSFAVNEKRARIFLSTMPGV
jgi:hypothetical protein